MGEIFKIHYAQKKMQSQFICHTVNIIKIKKKTLTIKFLVSFFFPFLSHHLSTSLPFLSSLLYTSQHFYQPCSYIYIYPFTMTYYYNYSASPIDPQQYHHPQQPFYSAASATSAAGTTTSNRSPPMPKSYLAASSLDGPSSPSSTVSSMTSPSSSAGSSVLAGAAYHVRFEASRGFDVEDDLEFCPALASAPGYGAGVDMPYAQPSPTSPPYSSSHATATTYFASPSGPASPPKQPVLFSSPSLSSSSSSVMTSTTSTTNALSSPRQARLRRGIQIVDPSTGLRVASPPLTPAGLGKHIRV